MIEQKKNILAGPFCLAVALTLLAWVMNVESIQEGITMSFRSLIGLAFLFPVLAYFTDFVNGKSMISTMLFPVLSLEKYTSIWSGGILTALYSIISSAFLMSIFWVGICTVGYDMTTREVYHAAFSSAHLWPVLVSWTLTSGFVLCIIVGKCQKSRLKYTIPICFISILIAWIVLLCVLPLILGEEAKKICLVIMLVFAFLLGVVFMRWGYSLFKRIQFNNK